MSYSPVELEVLSVLALGPKGMLELKFEILHRRHTLPAWVFEALEAKWKPPRSWYKEEREEIGKAAHRLHDYHVIGLDVNWRFRLRDGLNEMEVIAWSAL